MKSLNQPTYVATDIKFLALIERLLSRESSAFGTEWRGRYWSGERSSTNGITIRGDVKRD